MDWLTDPFSFAFLQRAATAGVLTAIAAGVIGTWVVLRGQSFLGDALAHGVVPGVAIAFATGVNLLLGGAISALVMIGLIAWLGRRTELDDDTNIGLLFVGMLALGVVVISRGSGYQGELTAIIFGDPLGVTTGDLLVSGVVAVVAVLASIVGFRPFLALSFSEDKSRALGLRPDLANTALLVLVAMVVVGSFRAVGSLLVFAFLVAPPATGILLARRIPTVMAVSVATGSLGAIAGLLASYHLGTAGGASMALATVVIFVLALGFTTVRDAATSRG